MQCLICALCTNRKQRMRWNTHAEVTNRSSETAVLETVHDVYFRDCEFGSQDFNNKTV